MGKILLVLLLGAVFLPASNVGATLYQEQSIFAYDGGGNTVLQLDFTIGIFTGNEWGGANGVPVAGSQWIYTYEISSAATSRVSVNNLTMEGLVDGFVGAGVIGDNTDVATWPAPDGGVNWTFTFGDGLGPGETSDLLYVISNLDPYVNEKTLRSAVLSLLAEGVYGTGALPAPGLEAWTINASVNPVPEPATLLLVGSALLIGAGGKVVRRRKRM
jgi:hypothetical protein